MCALAPPLLVARSMSAAAPSLLFGPFQLDLATGELRKEGINVRLQQQPLKVLALLAQRPGELVTREEFQQKLWGEDVFVDFEHGLNFCIRQVRSALDDQAAQPRYVETLPRRGYRFIAAVTRTTPPGPVPSATDARPLAETLLDRARRGTPGPGRSRAGARTRASVRPRSCWPSCPSRT